MLSEWERILVETPGTAPGSVTIIPLTVYRHSQGANPSGTPYIGARKAGGKSTFMPTLPRGDMLCGVMPLTSEQRQEIEAQRLSPATTSRPTVPALEEVLFAPFELLDHGFVRVVDYMGDDGAIVQAARVSYGRGTKKVSEDSGLIRYLMRHRHSTPFEMCEIKFHVKLPVFVARQWIRHRMANVNEYSARYSILDREFYLPSLEQVAAQSQSNRQGRADALPAEKAEEVLDLLRQDASRCYDHYEQMLDPEGIGLARELARMNLTLNTYTQWYWKIDLHNFLHFLSLRADPHAQYEIRVYAEAMIEILRRWVPVTCAAFEEYRLGAFNFSAGMLRVLRCQLAGEAVTQADSGLSRREWDEMQAVLKAD
ncbi:FAD-dependent thymidylate synthase [Kozakia baliensis NRIC 0488]|nr:FAD-dependent thymidylate synthase [Kozakia baliensis NRIC 0488]